MVLALSKGKAQKAANVPATKEPLEKFSLYQKFKFLRDSESEMFLMHLQSSAESLLDFIVGNKHNDGDGGSSDHSGSASSPKGEHSFLLDDSSNGIEETSVVSSLFLRQLRIGLDSHQAEISWVTNQASKNTRGQSVGDFPERGNGVL